MYSDFDPAPAPKRGSRLAIAGILLTVVVLAVIQIVVSRGG